MADDPTSILIGSFLANYILSGSSSAEKGWIGNYAREILYPFTFEKGGNAPRWIFFQ